MNNLNHHPLIFMGKMENEFTDKTKLERNQVFKLNERVIKKAR